MAATADEKARLRYEGFGPDDTESGRAQGQPAPAQGTSKDPAYGPATKADTARMRRDARSSEREFAAGYPDEASSPSRKPSGGRSRPGKPGAGPAVPRKMLGVQTEDAGGFLLALLFGWPLFVNYLRGGPTQAKAWIAAKFINKTASTSTATAAAPFGEPAPSTGAKVGQTSTGGFIVPTGPLAGQSAVPA